MSLQVITCVWGTKHLDMFRKGTLKTLSYKQNKKALYEAKAKFNLFTDQEHVDFLYKIVDAEFPELEVNVQPTTMLRRYNDPIQAAFIWQIEECLRYGHKLLIAPPDTLFGDESIPGILKVGREKGACVAVPHPRVNPSILNELDWTFKNEQMVSLAWKHLHRSWVNAEVGHPNRNSFIGGVHWSKISPKIISISHRLPTVYLADFTLEDLKYFQSAGSFGVFDHLWPGHILIPRGRQRTVGSSDVAFVVEVTEFDKNIPPMSDGDPDDFWQKNPHNEINKQFISVFRGIDA